MGGNAKSFSCQTQLQLRLRMGCVVVVSFAACCLTFRREYILESVSK